MRSSALLIALALGACSTSSESQPAGAPQGDAQLPDSPQTQDADSTKPQPPPLSAEDQRLIALDPAELTPELRRERAYALRRKAMQNPDSPLARTLTDLQNAYYNGEIDPASGSKAMPTFTVDGKPPTSGTTKRRPAAGVRPAEE